MSYTDDLILNSLKKSREDIEGEPDTLLKAMNKAGLVQKEVQVRGKNGQVFTRKQWVKAGEDVVKKDSDKSSSTSSAITSYKGKTLSEMRVLFNGKTAKDVQEEKGRIFKEMGSPSGSGTEMYKKFKESVSPLDQLIADTINNGTGSTSGDYATLMSTSIVKAKPEDKTTVKKDEGKIQYKLDKTNSGKVGAVWIIKPDGGKESATVVSSAPDSYNKKSDVTVEGKEFTIYTTGNNSVAVQKSNGKQDDNSANNVKTSTLTAELTSSGKTIKLSNGVSIKNTISNVIKDHNSFSVETRDDDKRGKVTTRTTSMKGSDGKEYEITRDYWSNNGKTYSDIVGVKEAKDSTPSNKFTPASFGFRAGGQNVADFVNSVDKEIGVKSHLNGNTGFGTLKLENGESVNFGYDDKGAFATWSGVRYRDAKELSDKMNGRKSLVDSGKKVDSNTKKPSLSDIQGYGYDPATATGDPTLLKIGDKSYYKIGENKWQYNPSQSSALGGTYTDSQISDKISKTTEEVKVIPSYKKKDKKKDSNIPTQSSTKLSKDDAKKKTQSITSSIGKDDKSRNDFMAKAKAQGIVWKENDHIGINWMRCCMAMNKHFENGETFDPDKK